METQEKRRVYPSQQLTVALQPNTLKVLLWICGWGASVKYYPKQFAKACKFEEDEVEIQIQTLVNANLVDVSKVDGIFILSPNPKTFQKYYEIPLAKVLEGSGIPIATEVSWNCEGSTAKGDISDMSDEQLKLLLRRIQVSLSEREQLKKKVVTPDVEINDLPF